MNPHDVGDFSGLAVDKPWLMLGDCLERMKDAPDGSVDMICCDLPYGTTACKWDTVIPFAPLWDQYKRVIKPNGAIVLTAAQPFTSSLVCSNQSAFKYAWVWDKASSVGFLNAKVRPLARHEDVLVFSFGAPMYQPRMRTGKARYKGGRKDKDDQVYGKCAVPAVFSDQYYPTSIIEISNANRNERVHPTQKPVPLMEYLIETYTNPGDTVLDSCMGSGTTGVGCVNTGRKFIGIEKNDQYFEISRKRIEDAITAATQPAPLGGLFDDLCPETNKAES